MQWLEATAEEDETGQPMAVLSSLDPKAPEPLREQALSMEQAL